MKRLPVLLLTLLLLVLSVGEVSATSGQLKKSSIVSCGGNTYGSHGDGHWHYAVQRGDRWYPDGAPLGHSNPCSSSKPTQDSKPNTTPEPSPTPAVSPTPAPKPVKEVVDQAAIDKANKEKEEQARLDAIAEEERVKKEQLAQKLRESTVINSIIIDSKNVENYTTSSDVYVASLASFKSSPSFVAENKNVTVTHSFEEDLKPFEKNVMVINVESENKENQSQYNINVFPIGEASDLEGKTVVVKIGDKEIHTNEIESLTSTEFENIKSKRVAELIIDNYVLSDVPYTLENKEDKSIIILSFEGLTLEVPIEQEEIGIVPTILGTAFLGGAGYGTYHLISKRKKAKK